MTSVSEKVLKNIEKHKITPKPKWVFVIQNLAIWFSSLIFLTIGGFAFSVVIYMIKESDWGIYGDINDSLIRFTLLILPYFWIIILACLVFIANYNIKNTKTGYKYRLRTIVVAVFALSMLLGAIFYALGMGKAIDEAFVDRVPMYGEFVNKINRDQKMWMNPDRGLLGGMVISIIDENQFQISDFNNDVWNILSNEKTITQGFELQTKGGVKIVGREIVDTNALSQGERAFEARIIEILPELDFLKRHPMGAKRMFEMNADIQRRPPASANSFMQMEYDEGTPAELEKGAKGCSSNKECSTPFEFMVKSSCPFESKCLKNNCKVVCPMPFANEDDEINNVAQCQSDIDCDCEYYKANDASDCICSEGVCFVVIN